MPHEPKLSVFTLTLRPLNNEINSINRILFKHKINEANVEQTDSYLFGEIFRLFILKLDTAEMYKDTVNKKTMTANQADIEQEDVLPNIKFDTGRFIIHGVIEGGPYGRKRKKRAIGDKSIKTDVSESDAITDDFFFLIYLPPSSNKSILMVQSFTDETIDSVVKLFWEEFLSFNDLFNTPKIKKFIPTSIIEDFKQNSVITQLDYSTTVTGNTLLDPAIQAVDKNFKVTIRIEPIGEMTVQEFENAKQSISSKSFTNSYLLRNFRNKKAVLKDSATNKTSNFELNSDFDIHPVIFLNKYIQFPEGQIDYGMISTYCFNLLSEEIMPQIYPEHAIQEH